MIIKSNNKFLKKNYTDSKIDNISIDIETNLGSVMKDDCIKKVLKKIETETEGIPHVNITFHISWGIL